MTGPYEDIIHTPHHQSAVRPHMSSHDRAAQFSPFAALSGYESAITEAKRITNHQVELDATGRDELNEKLFDIQTHLEEHREVSITYFLPDKKKSGGAYVTVTGCVKKIDAFERTVLMQDTTNIPMDDILAIDITR